MESRILVLGKGRCTRDGLAGKQVANKKDCETCAYCANIVGDKVVCWSSGKIDEFAADIDVVVTRAGDIADSLGRELLKNRKGQDVELLEAICENLGDALELLQKSKRGLQALRWPDMKDKLDWRPASQQSKDDESEGE